ncbi:hypothetical protein L3Q82_007868 [Scortum barcoo]|uniref:Uncharacterized protein n=1 Tax=Scortum barcoo TaxID=214431 RepID=A0ACB8WKA4_9TELE|nr:hypothetical protein L3Q82_007868 [Scortum barcoo]
MHQQDVSNMMLLHQAPSSVQAKFLHTKDGPAKCPVEDLQIKTGNERWADRAPDDDVVAWGESLDQLLECKTGQLVFEDFLRTEYSEENLLFWLACEEYKKITSETEMKVAAKRIYAEFVQVDAPRQTAMTAAYREEVDRLAEWCDTNNLLLNTGKTKELIVDFRRNADPHSPIHIKGMTVERVNSFKFLGVHISEDLTWTTGCSKLVKKAHQRLFFLRTLRKNHLSSDILVNFYRCTIESILTSCITVWYGSCSAADRKALQRVVKAAQRIAGAPLPSIEDIYRKRCLKRAGKIIKDSSHPAHRLFTLLPSGKRYRSARTKTTRTSDKRNYIMMIYIHKRIQYISSHCPQHVSRPFVSTNTGRSYPTGILQLIDIVLNEKRQYLAAFRAFLRSEFSEENIEFWLACEEFKVTASPDNLRWKAEEIYKEFIQPTACREINVDHHIREKIKKSLEEPSLSCFDEAQKHVYLLMERDSRPRFLHSDAYLSLKHKSHSLWFSARICSLLSEPIITSIDGLATFRNFLKSEYSDENIEFWLTCEDYKKIKSSFRMSSRAKKIYEQFIKAESPKEINIDYHTREQIKRNVKSPTMHCFDDAQKIVYGLMERDSYPRFLRSDIYRTLLENLATDAAKG